MPRLKPKKGTFTDVSIGVVLIIVGVVLVAALAGGAWWVRKTVVQLDGKTLCPVNGPRVIHLIMIDQSDPIEKSQAQRIRQYAQKLKEQASFGTRFDIYTVEGEEKNVLTPRLTICSPNRPADANELIENPDRIRERYETGFSQVLDRALEELLRAPTLPTSPIVESLRAAAVTSFGPTERDKIPLRVTIISDMVQHTKRYSHFQSEPNFPRLSQSPTWVGLRPDLKGADVHVLYLLRPAAMRGGVPIQNRGHQLFWEQLFVASGGRLPEGGQTIMDLLQ